MDFTGRTLFLSPTQQLTSITSYFGLVAWRSGNAFHPINDVTLRRAGFSTRMGDCLQTGKPFRYVTSRLGKLSLPSLRGR